MTSLNTMEIWQAFIAAQDLITSQYSQPIDIVYESSTEDGDHHFKYVEETKKTVQKQIKRIFKGILEANIDLNSGYFLYQSEFLKNLDHEKLEAFKDYCDANYYDFIPKPCISGEVNLKYNPFQTLCNEIGIQVGTSGECFATLEQIQYIDQALENHLTLERAVKIGAISKISASELLINKQFTSASNYLKEQVGLCDFSSAGITKHIIIPNVYISARHSKWISENTLYRSVFHRIIITPHPETFASFQRERKNRSIYFADEDQPELSGIILPNPHNDEFHFRYNENISVSDLKFEILFRKRSFETYLKEENFEIRHEHVFKIDNQKFLAYIKHTLPPTPFQISEDTETIAFDFTTIPGLETSLKELDNLEDIYCKGFQANHSFKVKLNYQSPLEGIAHKLQEIPSIQTMLDAGGTKLLFRCYFDETANLSQLKTLLVNRLNDLQENLYKLRLDEIDEGLVKFSINFRQEEYKEETLRQLQYLRGEELFLSKKKQSIGILTKVKFPNLVISSKFPNLLFEKNEKIQVYGSLKGEKDKIKRLQDTVRAIFDDKTNIINPNLKKLLVDPSTAYTKEGDITLTEEYSALLKFVESELLTPKERINPRQLEAVIKSVISQDLYVIQGPPGTGKSTAIAEIIWQHIRNHFQGKGADTYKVLVTSETNLAVDNALDKLRSRHHTLIKPIRFGAEDKLDKEGKRFALENLQKWLEGSQEKVEASVDLANPNIIEDWIQQISARALHFADEKTSKVVSNWRSILTEPKADTRRLFFDAYLEHVNVVGATCSSIGKLSSTGKQTRFFREYMAAYHPTVSYGDSFNENISFDLIIQDEASKASPPELALPCIYGQKAIIIGDHRQLPPMIDTNEFKENLEYLKNRSKDRTYKRGVAKLIKTIDENRSTFETSHFEKLFKAIPSNLKTTFNLQYRMHPAINETIKQFYQEEGGLECGLVVPVDLGVNTPDLDNFASRYHGIEVENMITSDTHVLWMNVDTPEFKVGTSRINQGEIEAIDYLLGHIGHSAGYKNFSSFWPDNHLEEKQIGIITFYGAQAQILKKLEQKYPEIPLRVSPVDRFQGMERNIIIVSTVRSNKIATFANQKPDYTTFENLGYPIQTSLGFAEFPNRLNVALSRAKRLLIVVGNAAHFSQKATYRNVLKIIKEHPNARFLNYLDVKQ